MGAVPKLAIPADPTVQAELHEQLADHKAAKSSLSSPGAVLRFYEQRQEKPAWLEGRQITAVGVDALRGLSQLSIHGLDPSRYGLDGLAPRGAEPDDPAAFELQLTDAWLTAAAHLRGRVDPRTLRTTWTADGRAQELAQALETALAEGKPQEALLAQAPAHPEYVARVAALQALLDETNKGDVPKPTQRLLEQLPVDLERLRWLPREPAARPAARYMWIDLGAGQATLFEGTKADPTTRVAVSKQCRNVDSHGVTITEVIRNPEDPRYGTHELRTSGAPALVLHGAPEDRAFPNDGVARAGCWRLEDPEVLTQALLRGDPASARDAAATPPDEKTPQVIELDPPVTLHVVRTSVLVDHAGKPTLLEGAYAQSASLRNALAEGPARRRRPHKKSPLATKPR
ncbi:MAG: hypothetical protein AAGF11_02320 [Myxococcota bacterium]